MKIAVTTKVTAKNGSSPREVNGQVIQRMIKSWKILSGKRSNTRKW